MRTTVVNSRWLTPLLRGGDSSPTKKMPTRTPCCIGERANGTRLPSPETRIAPSMVPSIARAIASIASAPSTPFSEYPAR